MKKIILSNFLILIYFVSFGADTSLPVAKSKGTLVIVQNFLIKNFIQGELILFNKELHFKPHNNTHILKEIIIPFDKIDTISYHTFGTFNIEIKYSTGQVFKFGVSKRKYFFSLLKNTFALRKNKKLTYFNENRSPNIPTQDNLKTKTIIYTWGSTGLTLLYINGVIRLEKDKLIFYPTEMNYLVSKIIVNYMKIKKIRKCLGVRTTQIILNSGTKYRFKLEDKTTSLKNLLQNKM